MTIIPMEHAGPPDADGCRLPLRGAKSRRGVTRVFPQKGLAQRSVVAREPMLRLSRR